MGEPLYYARLEYRACRCLDGKNRDTRMKIRKCMECGSVTFVFWSDRLGKIGLSGWRLGGEICGYDGVLIVMVERNEG